MESKKSSHPYLVAVSFGPDSMALLNMLIQQEKNLVVCHVNYHKRKESDEEERKLKAFCNERNIPIHVLEAGHPLEHMNFQAWARDIRYRFFASIYEKYQAQGLFVAHHADDDVETFFMQKKKLLRVYGIQEERMLYGMRVIRPLLSYRKRDLYHYCIEHHIPFSIDSSNLENDYERNRIRHSIVEQLSDEEVHQYQEEKRKLNKKRAEQFLTIEEVYQDNTINISAFLKLDKECQSLCLHDFIYRYLPQYSFSKYKGELILEAIYSKKPNWRMVLEKPYSLVKAYEVIYMQQEVEISDYAYVLKEPGVLDTPYFLLDFRGDTSNRNVKEEDYPLTIRNFHVGDFYWIQDKKKMVNRLFLDWKMPIDLRKIWPVIVNAKGEIIYIPRYRYAYRIKPQDNFIVKSKLGI